MSTPSQISFMQLYMALFHFKRVVLVVSILLYNYTRFVPVRCYGRQKIYSAINKVFKKTLVV
jgi:hypothetical protein